MPDFVPGPTIKGSIPRWRRQSCSIGNSADGTTDDTATASTAASASPRRPNSVASNAAYSSPVRAARVSSRQSARSAFPRWRGPINRTSRARCWCCRCRSPGACGLGE